jgi:hypothetical protein
MNSYEILQKQFVNTCENEEKRLTLIFLFKGVHTLQIFSDSANGAE